MYVVPIPIIFDPTILAIKLRVDLETQFRRGIVYKLRTLKTSRRSGQFKIQSIFADYFI